jgi:hypothetical protein
MIFALENINLARVSPVPQIHQLGQYVTRMPRSEIRSYISTETRPVLRRKRLHTGYLNRDPKHSAARRAGAHPAATLISHNTGSLATAISLSICVPHPGQQNCRKLTKSSIKIDGSPMRGFEAETGRSSRMQPSL